MVAAEVSASESKGAGLTFDTEYDSLNLEQKTKLRSINLERHKSCGVSKAILKGVEHDGCQPRHQPPTLEAIECGDTPKGSCITGAEPTSETSELHRHTMAAAWEALKKSIVYFRGQPIGTVAAIDKSQAELNYDQVFMRDFVPSALAFLMKGEPLIVKNFLLETARLQSREKMVDLFKLGQGVMPASFKVHHCHLTRKTETLLADFGDIAIGLVAPVDSGLWWILLLRAYTLYTFDNSLAQSPHCQRAMHLILKLWLSEGFDTSPSLLCADGCSMIDRRMERNMFTGCDPKNARSGCSYSDVDTPSQRLGKPLIFCRTESDSPMENGYARPVEGIHVIVDMQNNVVIEFEDRKFVPLPPPDHLRNYTPGETRGGVDRSDVKPLIISQPEGPSFRITGSFVEWQKWNFRIGFTPKEGLVIHSVAYVDGNRGRRPIAHRLSFVEMVVPYGDPNEPHYRKNAFDAGEDGLGKNAHSLKKGCDCLGYIKYFDAHFTNFTGSVETIENCVCLHEEDHGILWKHQDWRTGLAEVRRSRRLTVSFICTIANYEYGFYWHFYQDGKIESEVKLTGILSLGALMPGEQRKYGTTIAPSLYAPVHQHFFVARMDMAVDCKPNEAYNQVVEVNVKVESAGPNNMHNNAFYAEEELLKSELQAMRDCDPSSARHWIVRNTRTVNRTGQSTGYKLIPGSNCLPFCLPEAKFLRRAGFLKHNLWVTSYKSDEIFPGGEFPNQNPRIHEGLATWVQKDRSLEETNIVLWYVFGITHIPRLEDWPVMPVEHSGFMLMPHGFFNCSPAVDVPPASDVDAKEAETPKDIRTELISKL